MGLRRAGYSVDVVGNATEARQLLEGQPYALVIADWRLPDGNGIDLADDAARRRARTLTISGFAIRLPAGAAERHGMLTKPVSIFELVAAVQRLIGNPSS